MTAPVPLSSWTGNLPSDVMLDAGVLYVGPNVFASTSGGLKFVSGKTITPVTFDGARQGYVALDRATDFKPVISGTILEISPITLPNLEPGAHTPVPPVAGGPSGATQLQPKQGSLMYAAGDYVTNLRVVWQRGDYTYMQIRFPHAICMTWDITGTDKTEVKIAVSFEARLDMSVTGQLLGNPSYVIEYFAVLQ